MADHEPEVAMYVHGDHAMLAGPTDAVEAMLGQLQHRSVEEPLALAQRVADLLTTATGIGAVAADHGGRWVQLTEQSQAWLQQFHAVPGADGSLLGVVRGNHGQFAHALSFTTAHVNPAVLADLHTAGATLALRLAIARLQRSLDRMEKKVDQLLADHHAADLGQIRASIETIDRAYEGYERTGRVADASWDQIQGQGTALAAIAGKCIELLQRDARKILEGGVAARAAHAARLADGELQLRLALLAVVQQYRLRWDELELTYLAQTERSSLDEYRAVAERATARMRLSVEQQVRTMSRALEQACDFTDFDRTIRPFTARKLVTDCHKAHEVLERFAHACEMSAPQWSPPELPPWLDSAKEVTRRAEPLVAVVSAGTYLELKGIKKLRQQLAARAESRPDRPVPSPQEVPPEDQPPPKPATTIRSSAGAETAPAQQELPDR